MAIVDPLMIFGSPIYTGFNQVKPEIAKNIRRYKAYDVLRIHPKVLIVGTSREEIGLRASNPAVDPKPAYNLGISATNIYEIRRYFEHAIVSGHVERVVIGVNLYTFNANRPVTVGFDESILYRPGSNISILFQKISRAIHAIPLSLDLIVQSWDTIKASRYGLTRSPSAAYTINDHLPDGQWLYSNESSIHEHGQYGHIVYYLRNYGNTPELYGNFSFIYQDPARGSTLDDLKSMLILAKAKRVQVDLMFGPTHALEIELIRRKGLMEKFEQLQAYTVRIVNNLSDRTWHPQIYDFTYPSILQTEMIPNKNDRHTIMQSYFDQSHWRPDIGDLVLDQIFLNKESEQLHCRILTKENLAEVTVNRRIAMDGYIKSNPWIELLFDEVGLEPSKNMQN